jgi:hypothetical protein
MAAKKILMLVGDYIEDYEVILLMNALKGFHLFLPPPLEERAGGKFPF